MIIVKILSLDMTALILGTTLKELASQYAGMESLFLENFVTMELMMAMDVQMTVVAQLMVGTALEHLTKQSLFVHFAEMEKESYLSIVTLEIKQVKVAQQIALFRQDGFVIKLKGETFVMKNVETAL